MSDRNIDEDTKDEKESQHASSQNSSEQIINQQRSVVHTNATFDVSVTLFQNRLGSSAGALGTEFRLFFASLIDNHRIEFEELHSGDAEVIYHLFYLLKSARDLLFEYI